MRVGTCLEIILLSHVRENPSFWWILGNKKRDEKRIIVAFIFRVRAEMLVRVYKKKNVNDYLSGNM